MTDSSKLLFTLLLLATAFLQHAQAIESELRGSTSLEGGNLEHPLGLNGENSTPFGNANLSLNLSVGTKSSFMKLSYDGEAYRFDPDIALDFTRQALGLEWIRPASRDAVTWSVGVQGAARINDVAYDVYDSRELYTYISFKTYPYTRLMTRGYLGVRTRRYSALPEESYVEPHAVFVAKRFWDSGTTLGTTLRIGGKWFHEDAAKKVWESATAPSASQSSVGIDFGHSLSQRIGVRASLQQRFQLQSFPYYVSQDIYDSPLLDRYAREGFDVDASLKVLAPGQLWIRLGGSWRNDDYGDILFLDGLEGSTRTDTTTAAYVSLERRFLTAGKGAILKASVSHQDQESNLEAYTWTGIDFGAGLEWHW